MKRNILYISIATAALTLSSCNDFLDKQPSVSQDAPVTEASQLLAIYDRTTHLETDNSMATFGTDSYGLPREQFLTDPSEFKVDGQLSYYLHHRDLLINTPRDYCWSGEYAKIYDANLIVESAGSVSGDEATKNTALAGAYLMRAYAYHVLATTYCKPWSEENKSSLGVPLRLKLDYEESLSRGTLEQTYDQILSDLEAAAQLTTLQAPDADMPWRPSQCAVNAMFARIYLCRGEFDKALDYTNKALANAPALYDYNTIQAGRATPYPAGGGFENNDTLYYSEWNDWPESSIYRYQEWIFPRLTNNGYQWNVPSKKLIALYDKDIDLRYKWLFVAHGNRRMNALYDAIRYCQFDDCRWTIEGPTTPELLLMKAELQVRAGQWQEGLQTMQPLYAVRHSAAGSFTASSQSEALRVVLDERHREFPFSFIRLMDIQRYATTATTEDDVVITRDFFDVSMMGVDTSSPKTYTINPQQGDMVQPIFQVDIVASQGAIEQNP